MSSVDPPSPCNRHCTLDPDTDTCLGCYRTLEEILRWTKFSPDEKRAVLATLVDRRLTRMRGLAARKNDD